MWDRLFCGYTTINIVCCTWYIRGIRSKLKVSNQMRDRMGSGAGGCGLLRREVGRCIYTSSTFKRDSLFILCGRAIILVSNEFSVMLVQTLLFIFVRITFTMSLSYCCVILYSAEHVRVLTRLNGYRNELYIYACTYT